MDGLKAFVEFFGSYPLWAKVTMASGMLLVFLTLVLAPRSPSEAVQNAADKRILAHLVAPPGFIPHSYPNLCVGLIAPNAWSSADAAIRFGGGEAVLIKRYEPTKGTVGLTLRLRNIQKNYINDLAAEVANQMDVWKKIDPNVSINDGTIAGKPVKVFRFKQGTGQRTGDVCVQWLRITDEVKLDLLAFIYDDAPDKEMFGSEINAILASMFIDEQGINDRKKLYKAAD